MVDLVEALEEQTQVTEVKETYLMDPMEALVDQEEYMSKLLHNHILFMDQVFGI
jgi:hypothetical protein